MRLMLSLALSLFLSIQITYSQWTSINPGAGGQVQDVVCDPNIPGRLFLACDMIQGQADNGPMESWDSGFSWSNVWMKENGFLSDVQVVTIVEAGDTPPGQNAINQ